MAKCKICGKYDAIPDYRMCDYCRMEIERDIDNMNLRELTYFSEHIHKLIKEKGKGE